MEKEKAIPTEKYKIPRTYMRDPTFSLTGIFLWNQLSYMYSKFQTEKEKAIPTEKYKIPRAKYLPCIKS